jgi:hypothetical protein
LLRSCCTTCCTTNPQQIEQVELELKVIVDRSGVLDALPAVINTI